MAWDKDRGIAAQNSATAAATVYAAELASTGGTFDGVRYEEIRSSIFNGTLGLAGAESLIVGMESGQPVQATGSAPTSYAAPSGGGAPNSDFTLNFGKHRGKTLAEIAAINAGQARDNGIDYLKWVVDNAQNDFAKAKVAEFLAVAA